MPISKQHNALGKQGKCTNNTSRKPGIRKTACPESFREQARAAIVRWRDFSDRLFLCYFLFGEAKRK